MAAAPGGKASGIAVRRLRRDLESLHRSRNPQIAVRPSGDNLLEWHFVLHSLPADTPYHTGCYHGKILFPPEYPHAPPGILMLTPSGRLETDRRLCLSMTDFHPESWNPAWSVETILVGLLSFFISDAEHGYGAISMPEQRRMVLATESRATNAGDAEFRILFPEFMAEATAPAIFKEEPADGTGVVCAQPPSPSQADCGSAAACPADAQAQAPEMVSLVEMAAGDLPLPPAGNEGIDLNADADDTSMECWICRDTDNTDPLIQPCGCRGSMSSVHASCVEQWIRHHRRSAVNDAAPCCSVCHQPYNGYESRPGVGVFVRHLCHDTAKQFLRTVLLVCVLYTYQVATDFSKDAAPIPMILRVVILAFLMLLALHKITTLMVSLPMLRPPPQHRCLRYFFVTDHRELAMHIAEAFAAVVILGFWCVVTGALLWQFFLPVVFVALVPVAKLFCQRGPSMACFGSGMRMLFGVLLAPIIIIVYVIRFVWKYPSRVAQPLDAGLHIAVAIAVAPMCLICESNVGLVILWGVHSLLVFLGLIERLLVKRWQWKQGNAWLLALQLTSLDACMVYNICEFPKGFGFPDNTDHIVQGISALWLLLVTALAVHINWELCLRYYRTWQHRNGTFRLEASRGMNNPAADTHVGEGIVPPSAASAQEV